MNTTEDFWLWFHNLFIDIYMSYICEQCLSNPNYQLRNVLGTVLYFIIFPLAYPNMATANKQAVAIFNKEMGL